jgi:hypothetical protein
VNKFELVIPRKYDPVCLIFVKINIILTIRKCKEFLNLYVLYYVTLLVQEIKTILYHN